MAQKLDVSCQEESVMLGPPILTTMNIFLLATNKF